MFGKSPQEKEKEDPQEWRPIPNDLEDIVGDRCTYGKYIVCISFNDFDFQRGEVKCSHQRYFKYGSCKKSMITDYHQINTDRKKAKKSD